MYIAQLFNYLISRINDYVEFKIHQKYLISAVLIYTNHYYFANLYGLSNVCKCKLNYWMHY